MKVNKSQALMFIFETLLKVGYINRNIVKDNIEIKEVTFRRYIQEIRAYLVNFDEPYEVEYNKSEDKYFLKKI